MINSAIIKTIAGIAALITGIALIAINPWLTVVFAISTFIALK